MLTDEAIQSKGWGPLQQKKHTNMIQRSGEQSTKILAVLDRLLPVTSHSPPRQLYFSLPQKRNLWSKNWSVAPELPSLHIWGDYGSSYKGGFSLTYRFAAQKRQTRWEDQLGLFPAVSTDVCSNPKWVGQKKVHRVVMRLWPYGLI